MLMTHLLSAVFKAIVMLSQGSIHFRQEWINIISYVRVSQIPIITSEQLSYNSRQIIRREKNSHI
jgi:L-asparaginase/Glu-tRNA(Gln) amidotransferase subunit D